MMNPTAAIVTCPTNNLWAWSLKLHCDCACARAHHARDYIRKGCYNTSNFTLPKICIKKWEFACTRVCVYYVHVRVCVFVCKSQELITVEIMMTPSEVSDRTPAEGSHVIRVRYSAGRSKPMSARSAEFSDCRGGGGGGDQFCLVNWLETHSKEVASYPGLPRTQPQGRR